MRPIGLLLLALALAPAVAPAAEPVPDVSAHLVSYGTVTLVGPIHLIEDPAVAGDALLWLLRCESGRLDVTGTVTSIAPGSRPRLLVIRSAAGAAP